MALNPYLPNSVRTAGGFEHQQPDYNEIAARTLQEGYSFLDVIFNPVRVQDYSFAQQMAAQDYANKYNSPANQMALMKEAGINPNLAAAGIAKSGASAGAQGADAAGPATGDSLSGLAAAGAGAVDAAGNVVEKMTMLEANRQNVLADTALKFESIGFTNLQSKSLAIALQFAPEKERLAVATLAANLDNIKQSYNVMLQQIEESKQKVEEMRQNIELMRSQGNLNEALKLEAQMRTQVLEQDKLQAEWRTNIMQQYGIDPALPVAQNFLTLGVTNNPNYEQAADIVYNYSYHEQSARATADALNGPMDTPASLLGRAMNKIDKELLPAIENGVKNLGSSSSAKEIRAEIRQILDNLYEQEEKYGDDNSELIMKFNQALSMSNAELVKWWKKENK